MIAVVDTNIFINRALNVLDYKIIYVTSSVLSEVRDNETRAYYEFNKFNLEIKDPSKFYYEKVSHINNTKNLNLSEADIDVVALTLELSEQKFDVWITKNDESVKCLSEDNGIKQALSELNLLDGVRQKNWKYRCYTCYKIYDEEKVFCRECGYNTITRVSVYEKNGEIKVNFKKGFVYRSKEIKDKNGHVIKSEDQKEFVRMKKHKERKNKKTERMIKSLI